MPRKSRQRKSHGKRPPEAPAGKTVPIAPATHKPWQIAAVCVVLAVVTVVAFRGVRSNDFLTYDDLGYVLQNRQVQQGLTMQSIAWAFTTFDAANWHPLTWISPHGGLEPLWQKSRRPPYNQCVFARRQCSPAIPFAFVHDRLFRAFRHGRIPVRAAPRACRIRCLDC